MPKDSGHRDKTPCGYLSQGRETDSRGVQSVSIGTKGATMRNRLRDGWQEDIREMLRKENSDSILPVSPLDRAQRVLKETERFLLDFKRRRK